MSSVDTCERGFNGRENVSEEKIVGTDLFHLRFVQKTEKSRR